MYHQFLTVEDKTGLVVGFDGCMAEDSHSFYNAFQLSNKSKNQGKWHRRPAEIFAGKLGDLSLRMGRYKLIRFNPPKDRRTGPSAQHLRPNDQSEWPKDEAGLKNDKKRPSNWQEQSMYQKCTWAPEYSPNMKNQYFSNLVMARKGLDKTDPDNTRWMCQRDFYYELWDLHTNPGEKNLCSRKYSIDVWESMRQEGGYQAASNPRENPFDVARSSHNNTYERGLGGNTIGNNGIYGLKLQEGKPEKHPDPAGIGSGKESTPVPGYINDCCLMDYGDWSDTCTNGDDDVCENPKNDPIKTAADILKINAAKIPMWLRKDDNVVKLFEAFPNDFKDHWAKRDEQKRLEYWQNRIKTAKPKFGSVARTGQLKLRYATRRNLATFPIFEDETCIDLDHQKYKRILRGAETEVDTGYVDMIMSDEYSQRCIESDANFIKNNDDYEWKFDYKYLRFLVPRTSVVGKWTDFFHKMANCKSTSCIKKEIDDTFDMKHRSRKAKNLFIPSKDVQSALVEGLKHSAQLKTETEYVPFCPKRCKSCLCNQRRGPSIRRRRGASATPENKFHLSSEHYVWLMDQFEPKLSNFQSWVDESYSEGFRCRNSPLLEPQSYNNVKVKDITGRFCKSRPEPTECKVAAHQGPVGNGFNIERSGVDADRSPDFTTEELEIKGFDDYTMFARCMVDVMMEIEGIAHHPELDEELKHYAGSEDEALWRQEAKNENYDFSGLRNGLNPRSLTSKSSNVRNLNSGSQYMASEPQHTSSKYLHGAGSRFIQGNNDEYYLQGCLKYLEAKGLPSAYNIPGSNLPGSQKLTHTVNSVDNDANAGDGPGSLDFDMDGSLLGYYPQKVRVVFNSSFKLCSTKTYQLSITVSYLAVLNNTNKIDHAMN